MAARRWPRRARPRRATERRWNTGPAGWPPPTSRARSRERWPARPERALLVAQRFDRIEPGGLAGGVEAEEDPDGGGEAEGDRDRLRRDERAPLGEVAQRL